ncbi:Hypothetical Protein XCAW_00913 [Xanthomonas citri subsp. citri Aw12879]|uniref:Uncharacterized protein n=1 Tax=Xanthomonas axonopodis pv. citri (strain 306) TaxID=190486 RepID=A0AAI7ZCZ0_XANAC|nr:hypothetical protein XAC0500 [Xanthomonas citri pv. citri str. 306]AGI06727.1 Hypothetical Protein XCAW_00913 [Xanthomonas citri subsp. citri Aw12879]
MVTARRLGIDTRHGRRVSTVSHMTAVDQRGQAAVPGENAHIVAPAEARTQYGHLDPCTIAHARSWRARRETCSAESVVARHARVQVAGLAGATQAIRCVPAHHRQPATRCIPVVALKIAATPRAAQALSTRRVDRCLRVTTWRAAVTVLKDCRRIAQRGSTHTPA